MVFNFLIILSIFLTFIAVRFVSIGKLKISYIFIISLFVISLLSISEIYIISNYFTGYGIDESVLYHIKYGFDGAGVNEYKIVIISIIMSISINIYVITFIFKKFYLFNNNKNYRNFISFSLFIVAFILNPASSDIYNLYSKDFIQRSKNIDTPDAYVTPELKKKTEPLNLIYIYLESLEGTYFHEDIFPDLVPGLKELRQQAVNFTNIQEVWGTRWTIAGMVASQCGVPLVTSSLYNSMGGMDLFLPKAVCMGDVLNEQGYLLSYRGGAHLRFAGKGKFYKTHGFTDVSGFGQLKSVTSDNYRNPWGLYDDNLLEIAFEKFEQLSQQDQPFGLFLLTLDTHHPNGHLSRACRDVVYKDGSNSILNAVHCSDKLVTEFIQRVKDSPYSDNTLLAVSSDHLAMRNTASDLLQKGDRKNLFFIISPEKKKPTQVECAGSSLDIGATVLSMLGFDVPALGFGRDLMRENSLTGDDDANADNWLIGQRKFLANLWNYPQLDKGLFIDLRQMRARFGSRNIIIPFLAKLDKQGLVNNIKFESGGLRSPKKLLYYVTESGPEENIIWVDNCARIGQSLDDDLKSDYDQVCISSGRVGNKNRRTMVLKDSTFFRKSDLLTGSDGFIGEYAHSQKDGRQNLD